MLSFARLRVVAKPRSLRDAAAAEGFTTIVAAGGDGTINEVVNGMAGTSAALGLLPMGTMNVFAMELGIPTSNLGLCWEIIQQQKTRLIDMPLANSKHFVQLAGVGLDAQVVKETSLAFKRSFGPLSYLVSAAQIAARQPPVLEIESTNAVTEDRFLCPRRQRPTLWRTFPIFQKCGDR